MPTTIDAISISDTAKYAKPYTIPPLYVLILKPAAFKSTMEDLGVNSTPKMRDGVNCGVSELGVWWFKNMYFPKSLIPLAKQAIEAGVISISTPGEMIAEGHLVHKRSL